MDQDQIEIITVNDRNSAGIEKPAGAVVGDALNGHDGSKEADSGSQPRNLNYTSVAQEVQEVREIFSVTECEIRVLVEARGLEPSKSNFWNVMYENFSSRLTLAKKSSYKRKEEIRSVKNEIYQVVGFFSAFQGLLITAAAQSNLLRCNNVRFILALSAFATAVAVFGIWQKNTALEQLQFAKHRNKNRMQELHWWLNYLRVFGVNFDFDVFNNKSDLFNYSCTSWNKILVSYGTWLVVAVIAFGGLCMVALHQILCNPGHSLPSN